MEKKINDKLHLKPLRASGNRSSNGDVFLNEINEIHVCQHSDVLCDC